MPSYDLSISKNYSLAGKSYVSTVTVSKAHLAEALDEEIPIAQAGILTIRSSGTAGSLTMTNADHGIADADKIDIYWVDADGVTQSCRHATVGTVSALVVPFTGAGGTALPDAATAIVAAVIQVFTLAWVGNNMASILAGCDFAASTIVFMGTGDTVELLPLPIAPGDCYGWKVGDFTNPLAGGTVDHVHMTHNDVNTVRNCRVGGQLVT